MTFFLGSCVSCLPYWEGRTTEICLQYACLNAATWRGTADLVTAFPGVRETRARLTCQNQLLHPLNGSSHSSLCMWPQILASLCPESPLLPPSPKEAAMQKRTAHRRERRMRFIRGPKFSTLASRPHTSLVFNHGTFGTWWKVFFLFIYFCSGRFFGSPGQAFWCGLGWVGGGSWGWFGVGLGGVCVGLGFTGRFKVGFGQVQGRFRVGLGQV